MLYIIFKDIYQSRKSIILYMVLGVMFILFNRVNGTELGMVSAFIFVLVYGIVSRNEYNEDKNGGYMMLRTLPIKSYKIVVSKFITAIILAAIGALFSYAVISIYSRTFILDEATKLLILAGVSVSLLFSGFLYILVYKFGATRAINISKILFFGIFFLPPIIVSYILKNIPKSFDISSIDAFINNLNGIKIISFVLIIYIGMMLISISIFEKKKAV
ncbi:ABC-2 transporter permease [Brassicibacter mesophilus]|uniref:ABC-2 transporter permease n=1 Tax=Brassicibacter mesophilus TaxID=745119 RepID=UPI003D1E4600